MFDPELFKQLQLLGQAQSLRNQQASLKTQQEIVKALKEQAEKEENEKKERAEKEQSEKKARAEKEQNERRDAELRFRRLEKKKRRRRSPSEVLRPATPTGPQCPHCGGVLPLSSDGRINEWTKCTHCREQLLWFDRCPFKTQQDIDAFAEEKAVRAANAAVHEAERAAKAAVYAAEQRSMQEAARKQREEKKRRIDEEEQRHIDERDAVLASLGLSTDEATFSLETTEGQLTVVLCRQMSMRWAAWFAAGVQQLSWNGAAVSRIENTYDQEQSWLGHRRGKLLFSSIQFAPAKAISMPETFLPEGLSLNSSTPEKKLPSTWKVVVEKKRGFVALTSSDQPPFWWFQHLGSDSKPVVIGYVPLPQNEQTIRNLQEVRADANFSPVSSVRITTIRCNNSPQTAAAKSVPLGTCLYGCALLVAADGKATAAEMQVVLKGLERFEQEQAKLQEKFVESCRRVRKEGVDHWLRIVLDSLSDSAQSGSNGMSRRAFKSLLEALVTCESDDTGQKQRLYEQLRRCL